MKTHNPRLPLLFSLILSTLFIFPHPSLAAAVSDVELRDIVARVAEEMERAKASSPFTGFFLVCAAGSAADMEAALAAGADPNAADPEHQGMPALTVAAAHNPDPGVIAALLKAGADIDARGRVYGRTALHMAVVFNPRPEVIKALLAGGPDLEVPDREMETALGYALKGKLSGEFFVGYPDEEILLLLLRAAAALPAKSMPSERRADYYAFCLEEYRDAFKPRYADTPNPSDAVIEAFRALGAVPDETEESRKESFREAARDLDIKTLRALLATGPLPDTVDEDGNGVLHHVMRGADGDDAKELEAVLALLLANGADPGGKNDDGDTPLHFFARWARIDDADGVRALLPVLREYVARGVDIGVRNARGYTPIFGVTATVGLLKHTLDLMLALGCDVNARDDMGMTPLIHEGYIFRNFKESEATESKGRWLIGNFAALREAGADPDIVDNEGKTAFDYLSPAARAHLLAKSAEENMRGE